ncbi:Serine protease, subtilisin family [Actinopolymorpha cephalotaxi]|uniref:Serine protease, subtilisin family n=1 Tax=Actinopolymorpha cephalotaxi TaxID=504797 RepID=A0A1I2LNX4_9ACTN|nr:S8 family serine peptidase [Actinopolymorpha cephalotaxi]NYH81306.1 subtilisin family serine protease [Actinopolymorpha cephalotaxi]SFF79117.1 Serine protease, subtilisin family [Actinopolymorpha cephalotaxi]
MRTRVSAAVVAVCAVVAALLTPTGLLSPTVAGAAPPGSGGDGSAGRVGSGAGARSSSAVVTLVTGDVVRLDTSGGQNSADTATLVRPAAGGGGYHSYTDPSGDAHFVPEAARRLLGAGRLDPALFDVSALVRRGFDDAHTSALPLILTYPTASASARAAAPSAARLTARLGAAHAGAVSVRKQDATRFWSGLTGKPANARHPRTDPTLTGATLTGGVRRVWLDAKVRASLDQSVPQIGAPAAWQRGLDGSGVRVAVLDTGIDATHPDFAGRIEATRDFSGKGNVVDGAGHGTHVASTVLGSGAASDGRYRGVAPGAHLLVGKVLGDDGSGSMSQVIEGMQWAASAGADVVNLSLGGDPSRGDDPVSRALDDLSDRYGTLFVVAAGNFNPYGQDSRFVTSPGAAGDALTVGAVSKQDRMYAGSRRGRLGDTAIKPEVVAPGVSITAAQAAGTGDGSPYTTMTGTSMATPHVAGSAALLLQEHPGWTVADVKAALTSTTVRINGATVVDQGAGRIDVDRATRQQVRVDQGTVDAGYFARPYDDSAMVVKKTLTYRNDGEDPVTLHLSTTLTDQKGQPGDASGLTVTPAQLTLPAGGSGQTTVTVDARTIAPSSYTGAVVATAAAVPDGADLAIRTTVGFYKQDDTVDISVKALDRHGRPAYATLRMAPYKKEDFDGRYYPDYFYLDPGETEQLRRVPEGDYNLWADILTFDESGRFVEEHSVVAIPRVHAYAPNFSIVLDARKAEPVRLTTPRASTIRSLALSWWRGTPGTPYRSFDALGVMVGDGSPEKVSVAGTDRVDDAPFVVTTAFDAGPPVLTGRIVGGARPPGDGVLHPVWEGGPPIDGTVVMAAADAGTASPDDLAGADLRGKLAVVRESSDVSYADQVSAVVAKGARAVLLTSAEPGVFWPSAGGPVPVLAAPKSDGDALVAVLGRGPASVRFVGEPVAPYAYDVAYVEQGQVPRQLSYVVRPDDVAQVDVRLSTTGTGERGWRLHNFVAAPCACGSTLVADYLPLLGRTRTEYVTARPDVGVQPSWQYRYGNPGDVMYTRDLPAYQPGQRLTEDWLAAPFSPGPANSELTLSGARRASTRFHDTLTYDIAPWTDSAGHWTPSLGPATSQSRLYRDGTLIASSDYGLRGSAQVPAAESGYRLETEVDPDETVFGLSTHARSTWTFRSAGNGGEYVLPLVDVDYTGVVDPATGRSALDLANTAADDRDVSLRLRVGHQLGSAAPEVRSVAVWVSFDEGTTWRRATVRSTPGAGEAGEAAGFTATYHHPRVRGSGSVSLRVTADDGAGNTVDQTLVRAYHLTHR